MVLRRSEVQRRAGHQEKPDPPGDGRAPNDRRRSESDGAEPCEAPAGDNDSRGRSQSAAPNHPLEKRCRADPCPLRRHGRVHHVCTRRHADVVSRDPFRFRGNGTGRAGGSLQQRVKAVDAVLPSKLSPGSTRSDHLLRRQRYSWQPRDAVVRRTRRAGEHSAL